MEINKTNCTKQSDDTIHVIDVCETNSSVLDPFQDGRKCFTETRVPDAPTKLLLESLGKKFEKQISKLLSKEKKGASTSTVGNKVSQSQSVLDVPGSTLPEIGSSEATAIPALLMKAASAPDPALGMQVASAPDSDLGMQLASGPSDTALGVQVPLVRDREKREMVFKSATNAIKNIAETMISPDFAKWFVKRMKGGSCGPNLCWRDVLEAGIEYLKEKQRKRIITESDLWMAQFVLDNPVSPKPVKSEEFDSGPFIDMFSPDEYEKTEGEINEKGKDSEQNKSPKDYICAALQQSNKIFRKLLQIASLDEFSIWMEIYAKECTPEGYGSAHLFNFGMRSLNLFLDYKQLVLETDTRDSDSDSDEKTNVKEELKLTESPNCDQSNTE